MTDEQDASEEARFAEARLYTPAADDTGDRPEPARPRDHWGALSPQARAVQAVGAALMIAVALFIDGATGIALGLLVGFVFTHGGTRIARVARPLAALGRAALPLLLPLLMIGVLATFRLTLWAQLPIDAVIVLAAWHLVIAPDLKRIEREQDDQPRERRLLLMGLVFVVALALVAVGAIWARKHVEQFESRGGWSTFFLLLTLIFWAGAILLRLASFATCWLRSLVALALASTIVRELMGLGVLPWGVWLEHKAPALTTGLIAVVAGGVVFVEIVLEVLKNSGRRVPDLARRMLDKGPPRSIVTGAGSIGLTMALLTTLAVGAAALAGLLETSARGGEPPKLPRQLVAPAVRGTGATDAAGRALALRYYPVLAFTEAERWAPIPVEDWLPNAHMTGPKLKRPWQPGEPLPHDCHNLAPSPCFKLVCSKGLDVCAPRYPRRLHQLQQGGAAYVRVLRWRPIPRDGSGDVFIDRGPFREQLRILLQYWFFYPYDRWSSPLLAGRFLQEHSGDWEAVTVGLADPWKPLFVGYSAHCGGHWETWEDVEKASGEHPFVAVATGSQANYPKADRHQPPNWTTCRSLPGSPLTLLTYALNARDTTAYDWQWYPRELIPVDGRTQPMSFPGRWGEHEEIKLTNSRDHRLPPGPAPASPPLQPLWKQPVSQIFCGPFEPRDCNGPEDSSK